MEIYVDVLAQFRDSTSLSAVMDRKPLSSLSTGMRLSCWIRSAGHVVLMCIQ